MIISHEKSFPFEFFSITYINRTFRTEIMLQYAAYYSVSLMHQMLCVTLHQAYLSTVWVYLEVL